VNARLGGGGAGWGVYGKPGTDRMWWNATHNQTRVLFTGQVEDKTERTKGRMGLCVLWGKIRACKKKSRDQTRKKSSKIPREGVPATLFGQPAERGARGGDRAKKEPLS